MGSIYKRTDYHCKDCNRRLARTADRKECETAGHDIEKRKSDVWWIQYYRNGKPHRESTGKSRKGEAQDILKGREGAIVRGVPVSPRMDRLIYDDAIKDVTNDYIANNYKTLEDVERRTRLHLDPVFKGRRMIDITTAEIRAYTAARKEVGASNAQINRELAILKRAFTLAVQAGKLYHKPHIEMLDESDNARSGYFEADQFRCFLANLPEDLRPAIEFAYITGWRITTEVLPLEWRQVDLAGGEVRVDARGTKNKTPRIFPLTSDLRRLLERQKAEHDRLKNEGRIVPLVFHRNGKRIRAFRGSWDNARIAAGCPGRIPHDLRRTAVRSLERAGVARSVAMAMVGHKTESIYRRYAIVNENDKREAARRLDAASR